MRASFPKGPKKTEPSVAVRAQINPSGLSDIPTEHDAIGFHPYVRAIAWFLLSEKTKPPLSISIEGPWGSGKTSFMLQLESELRSQNREGHRQYYIRFNAWRSDRDEALWAAFALTFIKQLGPQIPLFRRIRSHINLLWARIDWKRGWFQLLQFAVHCLVFLTISVYAATHRELFSPPGVSALSIGIPWVAAIYFGFESAKRILGNPLSYDLSKYVRDLKYEDKVAFIDRFQDDFAAIVRSYVGESGKVFVFIDDLDRCEVPRAAELLQAINLLLSADQGNLFFVLGLDREMVAAGIASKNEKILPYLAAGRNEAPYEGADVYRIGIDYGYNFMEKFIQIAFRVPRPDKREISRWISDLADVRQSSSPITPAGTDSIDIRAGSDPDEFDEVVERMAQLFEFNPRRLKQFVNVFRLRVMIALTTGVLAPAPQTDDEEILDEVITIQQLGLFTAILMRWSRLAGDLLDEPSLLKKLSSTRAPKLANGALARWWEDDELRHAINLDKRYSLASLNIKPLLITMPDTYFGVLGEGDPNQERTPLIGVSEGNSGSESAGREVRRSRRRRSSGGSGASGASGPSGLAGGFGSSTPGPRAPGPRAPGPRR